jgi:tricarballylate dehydrogenase
MQETWDVIVVGGGNAGFSAAHAAAERGRRVVLFEKGTPDLAGGNSYYTAGATRVAHHGLPELETFIEADERQARTEVPPYSVDDYIADMEKVTDGKNDASLTRVLAEESLSTLQWLNKLGLKYRLMYERQAYETKDGGYLFWGGLHIGNVDGGVGLIRDHTAVAERLGTEVRYGHSVTELLTDGGKIVGVEATTADGEVITAYAESVVLAAGGFEASADLRKTYLGEGWENAKVRGTPNNDGKVLALALAQGATSGGDWSTCHSVQWDAFCANNESNRELTNRLTRGGYPLGIIVNRDGARIVDEGSDFRNYTYAKFGRSILEQPGSIAYQVFDAKQRQLLRSEEYDMPGVSVFSANTIAELAAKIGVSESALTDTVSTFNSSIDSSRPFDPNIKDGRRADVDPVKSNWATALDTAPYYAFAVTCGITFTFGGLRSDTHGRVLNSDGEHLEGLYVCGEMLGGLFSGNYPGGAGLAAGMVFGRRAGALA